MGGEQRRIPCPVIIKWPWSRLFSLLCCKRPRLTSSCWGSTFHEDRSWTCYTTQCHCQPWNSCKCRQPLIMSSVTFHFADPIWNPLTPTHLYSPYLRTWIFCVRTLCHKFPFLLINVSSFCLMCSCWLRCSLFMTRRIIVVGWLRRLWAKGFRLSGHGWGCRLWRYHAFIGWDFVTCYEPESCEPALKIISQTYSHMFSHQQPTTDWSSHA